MTGGREPTRYAVVGTGAISQIVHVPILAERRDVELVAVSDLDLPKARSVAQRWGVGLALPWESVVARDDVDAVLLCTPNHLHEEMALAALAAGKHVYVERPVAVGPDGVERVLAAARATGGRLVVGLPHRFRPEVAALRSFVAGGELGSVYAVRGSWLARRVPLLRPTWRQDPGSGGGALMELGIPAIDLCLWLVGYPRIAHLRCSLTRTDHDTEDAATLLAVTEDGTALTLEVSNRYYAEEDRYYARVMGTEGSGSLPPLEVFRQLGGRPLEVTPRQPRPRGGENPYMNAYRRQIDHFVRTASGQIEPGLPEEQVELMRLLTAAYRSAEEGREVEP